MSKVWKFFEVHKEDKNKDVCNLCETIVSRGGFGKSASTSPLIIHLKRHHDDEFKKNFTTKGKAHLFIAVLVFYFLWFMFMIHDMII